MTTYPVAEIFTAPQGEGMHVGRLMTFVRLAGCTVGKPYSPVDRTALGLNVYQERCTDWTGHEFPCDTNYKMAQRMTVAEIMAEVEKGGVRRICLTGGEPLMHDVSKLIYAASSVRYPIHIETSGTIDIARWITVLPSGVHIAVSPKADYLGQMLQKADELKVLVGADFDEIKFVGQFGAYLHKTFLQPINNENTLDKENIARCLAIQMKYPSVRLSIQMHKVIGCR